MLVEERRDTGSKWTVIVSWRVCACVYWIMTGECLFEIFWWLLIFLMEKKIGSTEGLKLKYNSLIPLTMLTTCSVVSPTVDPESLLSCQQSETAVGMYPASTIPLTTLLQPSQTLTQSLGYPSEPQAWADLCNGWKTGWESGNFKLLASQMQISLKR